MSIFKKQDTPEPRTREKASAPRTAQFEATISIIGAGMKVTGDLSTEGTVRIEGQVNGTIRAGRSVVLGQSGVIEGDVFTEDAIIGGRVAGSIVASSRLELQGTCIVTGAIQTRSEHLKLEEGARFEGQVHMLDGEATEWAIDPAADPRPMIAAAVTTVAAAALTAADRESGSNSDHAIPAEQAEGVVFELLDEGRRTEVEAPLLL